MLKQMIVLVIMFVAIFAASVSAVQRGDTGARPAAACGTATIQYVVIQSHGYTESETALRATARRGYVVGKARYARSVHGLARGGYVERE